VVAHPLPEACSQCFSEPLDHLFHISFEGVQAYTIDINAYLKHKPNRNIIL
jgi:hypothetical protein